MLNILLKTANFKQYIGRFLAPDASIENVEQLFAERVGEHIKETMTGFESIPIHSHYLCSTIIDLPFSSKKFNWSTLKTVIAQHTSAIPATFINAYECASWGYSLRHALRNQREKRYVLLTMVDLNILELEYWKANANWGKSGFGITTVLLECDIKNSINSEQPYSSAMNIGVARGSNAIAEFTLAMRNEMTAKPTLKLAYPYFPENVTALFHKLIPKANFLPDYHPEFGHCFGADPWISIIKDYQTNKADQSYIAASVALNGYWAIANIHLNQQTSVCLSKVVL